MNPRLQQTKQSNYVGIIHDDGCEIVAGQESKFNYTANIFNVIFTVFKCVPISSVISLYGLHSIAAPSTVE